MTFFTRIDETGVEGPQSFTPAQQKGFAVAAAAGAGSVLVLPSAETTGATDTAAIQSALASGARVTLVRGATYYAKQIGTKTIEGVANRYCIELPTGSTLDLNGATIRLSAGQNASILMNQNAGTSQDSDITLVGPGTLDINETNQTTPATGEMAGIKLYNVARPRVENIRARNARDYFGRFLKCSNGVFRNLNGIRSDGDGWSFGLTSNDQQVSDSLIDDIYAEDCTNSVYGSLQGNGFICVLARCSVGKVETVNCGGGLKIQDATSDSQFAQLIFKGGPNGTSNSGVKIQGNSDAAVYPTRISIGQIYSEGCYGEGLHVVFARDLHISSYIGKGNGITAPQRDADIRGQRIRIDSYSITDCAALGAVLQDDGVFATEISIGIVRAHNSGTRAVQDQVAAGGFVSIGEVHVTDNRGGSATTTGTYWKTGSSGGRVGLVRTNLAVTSSQSRINIPSGNYDMEIGEFRAGTAATSGVVTLTNGATATAVANDSIFRAYVGGAGDYLHPIIEVRPINSSAMALEASGGFRVTVTDSSSGTGFSIKHATAGASDRVAWKVVGWKVLPVAPS